MTSGDGLSSQRSGVGTGGGPGSGRKYRSGSRGSSVDESLFASKGPGSKKGAGEKKVVQQQQQQHHLPPSAVVLTQTELARIKLRSVLKSEAEIQREREANDKILQEKKAAAKVRKEKMLVLAEEAKKKTKKTDIEIENAARDETIRQLAQEKRDDNLDLVKHLRSLQAKADAFTIRDGQRHEKEQVIAKEKAYNQRMDELMEAERVRDIARREAEEEKKRSQRVKDREVIMSQIHEREQRKIIEEEAREQEGLAMVALMRRYEEEDRRQQQKRSEEIARMKLEIVAANDKAISDRKAIRDKEKEEVQAILEYQLKRDAEMRQREEEEEARELAKKARQAELLAQQERSLNNQAELDELRARRAAEEKERAARTREREEAAKRKKDMIELKEARMKQAEHKKAMMAKEAALQQNEYEHAIRYTKSVADRERAAEERKKAASQEHLSFLKAQISEMEAKRRAVSAAKDDEGKKLKQEYAVERVKLQTIRDHMIREMENKGVNPKYLSEMKRADITKLQMR